ncbi:MAG: hypothetical protein ABEJ71_00740 [Halodesulfurarchaeum sp.]
MVTTQVVLAVGSTLLLIAGTVAWEREKRFVAYWLFAAGFAIATAWALVGMALPPAARRGMGPDTYLLFATMAGAAAVYFLVTVRGLRPR